MIPRTSSLKVRLGIGAGASVSVALLAAVITIFGLERISLRIDASLAAERRIDHYSALSTQVSSFIVIASEALQSGIDPDVRADRLRSLATGIEHTFGRIRKDLEIAVADAGQMGLDEQSRLATRSLGIARMEAHFATIRDGFLVHAAAEGAADREKLQSYVDIFARGFDPLLNELVTAELHTRDTIVASIGELRGKLTVLALVIAAVTLALLAVVYLGLIRPQFHRIDLLLGAAKKIGREDFDVSLPEDQKDEIGQLFAETNRMTEALAARKSEVGREWARLNEVISERTDELRAANASLAQIDKDRRRFFADVSHEFRTPLTVILSEAELGLKGAPSPEISFEAIHNRARRLSRRIDDLLRIARSESGRLELATYPFDLSEIIAEAVTDTRAELNSAGMVVTCPPAPPLYVVGDGNWTRQVMTGLIHNTIRHARAGGQIALMSEAAEQTAIVHIIDNGPGIAPEDQPTIFDRFAQGRNGAKAEGFGIGLALAKDVVERQGGTITITSPVPRDEAIGGATGTKVTIGILRAPD